jgi:hypothetical protein
MAAETLIDNSDGGEDAFVVAGQLIKLTRAELATYQEVSHYAKDAQRKLDGQVATFGGRLTLRDGFSLADGE